MNVQSRLVVTAADFTRHFGQLRHGPGEMPVFVTHHGRETHVLLSAAQYDRLRGGAETRLDRRGEVPDAMLLAALLPQGVLLLDRDGTIFAANPAAAAMLARDVETLGGRPLAEALPDLDGSALGGCIRRAIDSGEAQRADLPSPTRPGRWLQVDCRPAARATMVMLHDITDEVLRDRLADADRAAAQALRLHDALGEVRLSPRGRIDMVDSVLSGWLGLPAERLAGIALADLVPVRGRPAFRDALDGVLRGEGDAQLRCDLLGNDGQGVAVDIALVELRGLYGSEGALGVLARA